MRVRLHATGILAGVKAFKTTVDNALVKDTLAVVMVEARINNLAKAHLTSEMEDLVVTEAMAEAMAEEMAEIKAASVERMTAWANILLHQTHNRLMVHRLASAQLPQRTSPPRLRQPVSARPLLLTSACFHLALPAPVTQVARAWAVSTLPS